MKKTLLLSLLAAGSAHAAITPISAVTTTPPVDNQFGISDLTIGATIHTNFIIGTVSGWATTPSGNVFHHLGPANATGAPADRETAIGDTFISTGVYNDDPIIDFGRTLNDGDTTPIFIIERGNGGDSATIHPLVGGVVDTSWSISLSAGTDFGNLPGTDVSWNGSATTMSGTAFTLADFTGGAGSLTNVTGIQITANGLDPAMVGVLPEPEPVPGSLQLSSATYAGAYDSGGITVTVERTGGSAGAVSVDYATGDGSALAGTDYTATSGTLNWEEGVDGAQTVFIPLLNNPDSEGKSFSIVLSGETGGATLGNPSSATIDITGPPPNIILFFMDDMGINDVGAYSYPEANPYPASGPAPISYSSSYDPLPQPNEANGLTPNIDSLASDGLRMTSFYAAAPVCTPSRAGMLTGCYPTRVDMEGVIWNSGHTWGLNPAEVTVAERLKQAGYTTGLVGKWHVGVFGGSYGMDFHPTHHGFDTFFGLPNSNDSWLTTLWDNGNEVSSYTTQGGLGGTLSSPVDTVGEQRYLLEALTEQAIGFIDAADSAGQPFFLYFASHAPHTPCWPHPDFDGVSGVSQYYDVVAELDHRIGQILDKLDTLGIADNTLVIFTTDNGPWVTRYESSPSRRLDPENSVGSAYPFRGFKRGANEGGPRVPFLARLPGQIPAGLVVDGIGSSIDLLPTLLGLAGGERPAATIDGVDLWPLMNGSTATSPRTKFFYYEENDTSAVGVRKGDDKLIQSTDYDVRTGWFNLATDIQESTNLGSNTTLSALVSTHNSTMVRRTRATSTSNWIELDTDTVTVTEGGTATFSIRLHAPANVTVSVSRFSGYADLDVQSGASLSFTTGNYAVWQAVTLEAAADPDFVSSGATFRATASGLHLREIFALESDTTPPPLTPAESWRLFWFGQTENTGDAADDYDYESDGLVNLLERAFGTNPTVGETALTRATGAPPVLSLVDADGNPGNEYLALTYRRLAGGSGSTGAGYTADGISYFVELDTDLSGPWSSGAFTVLSVQDDTPEAGIQTVTVRSNTALTAAAREFIRLRISSAP